MAALGVLVAGFAYVLDRVALEPSSPALGHWTVLVLAMASGFFLAAGTMRLIRWRLVHDLHEALRGSAFLIMGGLCLPLVGFARLFETPHGSHVGLISRSVASFIVMWLLLRALRQDGTGEHHRPHRLLAWVFVTVPACFVALALVETPLRDAAVSQALVLVLVVSRPTGWFALAAYATVRGDAMPWARQAAPLFFGMGIAESFRGIEPDRIGPWTFAGVVMCLCIAGLGARSAMSDLDDAVRHEEHEIDELSGALSQASLEADSLQVWREQFTHDARSTVAGLRAALDILETYDGQANPHAAHRLHVAAAHEIGHLEHLLTRTRTQVPEVFDVAEVVRGVSDCARALGAEVSVQLCTAPARGRPGDLAAVLKALLANARAHAPGSRVELRVERSADTVRITCADDGPGIEPCDADRVFDRGYRGAASTGSGLGLFAARQLIRELGGDIELGGRPGATFHVTVPAAHVVVDRSTRVVPAQRSGASADLVTGVGRA